MRSLRERLESRLVADPATGCLLWQGCLNSRGYGCISVGGRIQLVHRVAWELENGPIPDGLPLDHGHARGCRHKHCANVAHLEPVTTAENNYRSNAVRIGYGPWPGAWRYRRYHAPTSP